MQFYTKCLDCIDLCTDLNYPHGSAELPNHSMVASCQDEWPDSLKTFLTMALSLSLDRSPLSSLSTVSILPSLQRGMNPKKQHEVSKLAGVVQEVCQHQGCEAVVDVGSGLVGGCGVSV